MVSRTDARENNGNHTGDDFTISISKIKGSSLAGVPPTISRLISINILNHANAGRHCFMCLFLGVVKFAVVCLYT